MMNDDKRMIPRIHGVGYLGLKHRVNGIGNKRTKQYNAWVNMLTRCYSEKYLKEHPTYSGCNVSKLFECYSDFYDWCESQTGFGEFGFQLDKDLLIKGNKLYSENTCVCIPQEINKIFTKRNNLRGDLPIGVYYNDDMRKFSATVNLNTGKPVRIGFYNTEVEAFNAYKEVKEEHIKNMADKWKDKIDERAYEALMNYQVEITD